MHDGLGPQLPEVLDQVVDERVIVVDYQHASHARDRSGGAGVPPPDFPEAITALQTDRAGSLTLWPQLTSPKPR